MLVNIGFIEEYTGRKRNQRFCAEAVISAIRQFDEPDEEERLESLTAEDYAGQ